MWSNDQAMWLPKGSIRAILAVGSMSSTIAMIFTGTPIPEWWAGIAVAINAAYFVQKAASAVISAVNHNNQ